MNDEKQLQENSGSPSIGPEQSDIAEQPHLNEPPQELDLNKSGNVKAPEPQHSAPSIGRIVHTVGSFAQTDGQPYAAIIIYVHSPTCVDLQAFDGGDGPGVMRQAILGRDWIWPPRI